MDVCLTELYYMYKHSVRWIYTRSRVYYEQNFMRENTKFIFVWAATTFAAAVHFLV